MSNDELLQQGLLRMKIVLKISVVHIVWMVRSRCIDVVLFVVAHVNDGGTCSSLGCDLFLFMWLVVDCCSSSSTAVSLSTGSKIRQRQQAEHQQTAEQGLIP